MTGSRERPLTQLTDTEPAIRRRRPTRHSRSTTSWRIRLRQITGGSVAVVQTTTLAHIAALPIMVAPEDLVLVDAQTHDSVHLATQNLKGAGIRVECVPHSDVSRARAATRALAGTYRHVWYLADGVYSMHGDLAPVKEVAALQGRLRISTRTTTMRMGSAGRASSEEATCFRRCFERSDGCLSRLCEVVRFSWRSLVFGDPARHNASASSEARSPFRDRFHHPISGAARVRTDSLSPEYAARQSSLSSGNRVGPFGDRATRSCRWPHSRQVRSGSFGVGPPKASSS